MLRKENGLIPTVSYNQMSKPFKIKLPEEHRYGQTVMGGLPRRVGKSKPSDVRKQKKYTHNFLSYQEQSRYNSYAQISVICNESPH